MRTAGCWTPSAGRRWQREAVPAPPRLAPLASESGGTEKRTLHVLEKPDISFATDMDKTST